jgi:PAS domain S-box-containing protein
VELKRIRILLIEDDRDYSQLIQIMLSKETDPAFDVKCTELLQTGLERLAKGGIDLVLLDLSLPDSRALDTFTSVYTQAPETPIVVLSCLDDEKLAIEALHKGAQDYLVKDLVDSSLLARSVYYAIERHRMLEELKRKTQALQASEAKNRAILNAIPDLMFQISKDGILLDHKAAKNDDIPVPRDGFLGKKVYEVLPTELAEQIMRYTSHMLYAGKIQVFEYQSLVKGSLHDYEARIVANGPDEVLVIVRDITKRKEAERMKNQFIWRLRRAGLW